MNQENRMSLLEKAIAIAAQAHTGQIDKAGEPYILHPIRVMLKMSTDEERTTAILHDVIEDSDWTLEKLCQEGFSEQILAAVDCLTKCQNEEYFDYIERICGNKLAVRVKLFDLQDNMNPDRLAEPTEKDIHRRQKYKQAYDRLAQNCI
jgi:(p)ppGpp synthase/HD superfamily hydrolase